MTLATCVLGECPFDQNSSFFDLLQKSDHPAAEVSKKAGVSGRGTRTKEQGGILAPFVHPLSAHAHEPLLHSQITAARPLTPCRPRPVPVSPASPRQLSTELREFITTCLRKGGGL